MKHLLILALLAGGVVLSTDATAKQLCPTNSPQWTACEGPDHPTPTRETREAPGVAAAPG